MANLLLNSGATLLKRYRQPAHILTQWKIVGNSEVHGQEIWSCGEYNPTDGKYHIIVQPLGGNIADIALDAPLRKVNDVADTIEFPSNIEGKALVTRPFRSVDMADSNLNWSVQNSVDSELKRMRVSSLREEIKKAATTRTLCNILCPIYPVVSAVDTWKNIEGICVDNNGYIFVYDEDYNQIDSLTAFVEHVRGIELIYELVTPTTELVDAPQIEEADSYTCEISQGAKAVSWSDFETDSE